MIEKYKFEMPYTVELPRPLGTDRYSQPAPTKQFNRGDEIEGEKRERFVDEASGRVSKGFVVDTTIGITVVAIPIMYLKSSSPETIFTPKKIITGSLVIGALVLIFVVLKYMNKI